MNIDVEIKEIITGEIFKLLSKNKFRESKEILVTIYNKYYNNAELYTKRLLLQNLSWVEQKLGKIESAKIYMKKLKYEIEKDMNYIFNNAGDYCLILDQYCEMLKDDIEDNEYKAINIFIANYYHQNNNRVGESSALVNIYMKNKQWSELEALINNLIYWGEDKEYIYSMLGRLEKTDFEVYTKIKEECMG